MDRPESPIEAMVRASGYLNATTTRWDNDTSDMMALPRRRVAGLRAPFELGPAVLIVSLQ